MYGWVSNILPETHNTSKIKSLNLKSLVFDFFPARISDSIRLHCHFYDGCRSLSPPLPPTLRSKSCHSGSGTRSKISIDRRQHCYLQITAQNPCMGPLPWLPGDHSSHTSTHSLHFIYAHALPHMHTISEAPALSLHSVTPSHTQRHHTQPSAATQHTGSGPHAHTHSFTLALRSRSRAWQRRPQPLSHAQLHPHTHSRTAIHTVTQCNHTHTHTALHPHGTQ